MGIVTGSPALVLGIETSCDETAAAVVESGRTVRSSVVTSQIDLHARFGGVVPEVASRAHVELLVPIVEEALASAGIARPEAIAVTVGPGLIGSLLVGVATAKAMALAWELPFVGVNHLEAHLYGALLASGEVPFPLLVLLVSGGHTMLVLMEGHGRYRVAGTTVDDAAGEAYDKVARFLGLGYPGGPAIDRLARESDGTAVRFPRPLAEQGLDFSFSGLKTAVIRWAKQHPECPTGQIAASFQDAVVDVLVGKTERALETCEPRALALAGGVAANSALRERFTELGDRNALEVFLPPRDQCTDNAAMIAAAGWWRLVSDGPTGFDAGADPSLAFPSA